MTLTTQTCTRCCQEYRVELDLLGNADSSICVPCLANRPPEFENDRRRQRVLFSGLRLIPGQLDLFATDGQSD